MQYKLSNIAAFAVLFILTTSSLISQNSLDGTVYDFEVLPNNDTILTIRNPASLWYGVSGGINTNFYYGDLLIPRNPNPMNPSADTINTINFTAKTSVTPWLGLMTEYKPYGQPFAVYLGLNLYDSRSISTDEVAGNNSNLKHSFSMRYSYISASPGIRYDLSKSLFLLTNVSIEYMTSSKQYIYHNWTSTQNKDQEFKVPLGPSSLRFGVNFGIGYDLTFLDISKKYRSKFTPYLMFGVGTSSFTGYNSKTNQFLVRLGFQVKLGKDNATQETIKGDPDAVRKPGDIAQYRKTNPIAFTLASNSLVSLDIKPISNSVIKIEADSTKSVEITGTLIPDEKTEVVYNKVKRFYAPSSEMTKPTKPLQTYLDEFVKLWQKDKSIQIDVVGYSDNQGAFEVNEKRAQERTNFAVAYLVKKGIPRLNIFDKVGGSRNTGENQLTKEGQRKSRRVDISIRKAPKR